MSDASDPLETANRLLRARYGGGRGKRHDQAILLVNAWSPSALNARGEMPPGSGDHVALFVTWDSLDGHATLGRFRAESAEEAIGDALFFALTL